MPTITITRRPAVADRLRAYAVMVDDARIGTVRQGETFRCDVGDGPARGQAHGGLVRLAHRRHRRREPGRRSRLRAPTATCRGSPPSCSSPRTSGSTSGSTRPRRAPDPWRPVVPSRCRLRRVRALRPSSARPWPPCCWPSNWCYSKGAPRSFVPGVATVLVAIAWRPLLFGAGPLFPFAAELERGPPRRARHAARPSPGPGRDRQGRGRARPPDPDAVRPPGPALGRRDLTRGLPPRPAGARTGPMPSPDPVQASAVPAAAAPASAAPAAAAALADGERFILRGTHDLRPRQRGALRRGLHHLRADLLRFSRSCRCSDASSGSTPRPRACRSPPRRRASPSPCWWRRRCPRPTGASP